MEYRNLIVGAITLIVLIIIGFGVYRLYQVRIAEEVDLTVSEQEPADDITSFPSPEPIDSPSTQGDSSNIQIQPESGLSDRENKLVSIAYPLNNQLLSSPTQVSGYANTKVFSLTLKDANGVIIGSSTLQGCDAIYPCEFNEPLSFANPTASTGTLEISANYEENPQVIPVTF